MICFQDSNFREFISIFSYVLALHIEQCSDCNREPYVINITFCLPKHQLIKKCQFEESLTRQNYTKATQITSMSFRRKQCQLISDDIILY